MVCNDGRRTSHPSLLFPLPIRLHPQCTPRGMQHTHSQNLVPFCVTTSFSELARSPPPAWPRGRNWHQVGGWNPCNAGILLSSPLAPLPISLAGLLEACPTYPLTVSFYHFPPPLLLLRHPVSQLKQERGLEGGRCTHTLAKNAKLSSWAPGEALLTFSFQSIHYVLKG